MKIDFQNLNISPMPNPKPLSVLRVQASVMKPEGAPAGGMDSGTAYIRNAKVDPAELVRR